MSGQQIKVALNPEGIVNAMMQQLWECQNVILFGMRSVKDIDRFPEEAEIEKEAFVLHIEPPVESIEVQKEIYQSWLLTKGFEDLIKGIKFSLIEAYFYVSIINKKNDLKVYADLQKEVQELRKSAIEQSLPGLLTKVKDSLTGELKYEDKISSINLCRNCLVHSNGIVTERHINDKVNNLLNVSGIRWKMFYKSKSGEDVEVQIGEMLEENTSLMLGQDDFALTFPIGSKIQISFRDFNNFIKTCYLFALDLKNRLPIIEQEDS